MLQNGVGDADIVLIHGGTNDWNKNKIELVPGIAIRSTIGPSDADMKTLFDAADKAKNRAEIEALDDTNFCSAYIKLICLIKERNPKVKIVCIIGDYVGVGVQQATHKMAAHYGAKVVDLLAVKGFNDQTYMPKLDYNPSTGSGCHPSSKAMEFIANKIYSELGTWLEE
jgi:lysophospholipase L1-like esterase